MYFARRLPSPSCYSNSITFHPVVPVRLTAMRTLAHLVRFRAVWLTLVSLLSGISLVACRAPAPTGTPGVATLPGTAAYPINQSATPASQGYPAATTGPNKQPRPASSTPATRRKPASQKACSRCRSGTDVRRLLPVLAQTGGFAAQFAEIVKLGPADLALADDLDLAHGLGM